MRQPMRRRLLTALMAAGLVGGMVLSSPSALGQPDVPFPPPPAPVDPNVALAPPPVGSGRRDRAAGGSDGSASGSDGSASAACGPVRVPAAAGTCRSDGPATAALRWAARVPGNAGPADGDPRRHPRRAEPDAVRRRAAVPAADVQPGQRVDGRRRQADRHQLRGPSPTGRWPRTRSTSRRSRRSPAGSTGSATPSCAGGRRTSGRPVPSSTSTPRRQVEFHRA